ncbi:MAG: hypothetical protein V3S83_12535 [Gemmatimonadota bacterium]
MAQEHNDRLARLNLDRLTAQTNRRATQTKQRIDALEARILRLEELIVCAENDADAAGSPTDGEIMDDHAGNATITDVEAPDDDTE